MDVTKKAFENEMSTVITMGVNSGTHITQIDRTGYAFIMYDLKYQSEVDDSFTKVDFTECESLIRKAHGLDSSEILYLAQIEISLELLNIKYIIKKEKK